MNVQGGKKIANYGKITAKTLGPFQSSSPVCLGNGAVVNAEKFGDVNGHFGNIKGGGTINVTKEFGNINYYPFDATDGLEICFAGSVESLPYPVGNQKWGVAN